MTGVAGIGVEGVDDAVGVVDVLASCPEALRVGFAPGDEELDDACASGGRTGCLDLPL